MDFTAHVVKLWEDVETAWAEFLELFAEEC